MSCAGIHTINKNTYKISCRGASPDKCEKKAWDLCDGSFSTLEDKSVKAGSNKDEEWEEGEKYLRGDEYNYNDPTRVQVFKYTYKIKCTD